VPKNAPCAACVQDSSLPHCASIPLDFTVLQETWAWLQSPASIGCAWVPPPAEQVCTFPSPGFNGLTTDYDYCAFAVPHPLKAGTPLHGTFANYHAMMTAAAELQADPSHLEGKPVSVLSTPTIPWSIPRAMPSSARSCRTAPWRSFRQRLPPSTSTPC
jgi:hypothetical protein